MHPTHWRIPTVGDEGPSCIEHFHEHGFEVPVIVVDRPLNRDLGVGIQRVSRRHLELRDCGCTLGVINRHGDLTSGRVAAAINGLGLQHVLPIRHAHRIPRGLVGPGIGVVRGVPPRAVVVDLLVDIERVVGVPVITGIDLNGDRPGHRVTVLRGHGPTELLTLGRVDPGNRLRGIINCADRGVRIDEAMALLAVRKSNVLGVVQRSSDVVVVLRRAVRRIVKRHPAGSLGNERGRPRDVGTRHRGAEEAFLTTPVDEPRPIRTWDSPDLQGVVCTPTPGWDQGV